MEGAGSGDQTHAQTSTSSAKLVEIKIKTLDSQVYSCNVDQNISVPALKEHVATLTGVPAENQRLICRGKVLKDDHTLMDYNVEDGHTLHLVTRQVPQSGAATSSAGANAGEEEQGADDPANGASRNRPTQISHSVVMGTFNVPDNGDGGLPDVNRIITSVLQSLGLGNAVPNPGNSGGPAVNPAIVAVAPAIGVPDTGAGGVRPANVVNQPGVAQATWLPTAAPGILPSIAQQVRLLQQAMLMQVTPDALTTIIQYLDGLEQALAANGSLAGQHASPPDAAPSSSALNPPMGSPIVIRGHPTPANLGAIIRRTMCLINGQAGLELNRLASQLENESSLTDAGARGELQSAALRDGVLLQHLGALLLELGRATLTLRVGLSAMESAVNAGPAVFISPAGPNPMMVQPLPYQPGAGFGTLNAATHHNPGMMGFPEVPRNVSIHIHANDAGAIPGFPLQGQGLAPGNATTQVPPAATTPPASSNSGAATTSGPGNTTPSVHAIAVPVQVSGPSPLTEQPGIRVVPMRTVVAAVPGNLQSRPMLDNAGVHPNILHPLLARFQQLNSQQGINLPAGAPGSSAVPPPAGVAQQAPSPAAPTIRAQVQVQAWVPDGQGGSRLVTNEEALRTLLNTTQAATLMTPQQQLPQVNTTALPTNIINTSNPTVGVANDNLPAETQQVSSDVLEEPLGVNPDVARQIPPQGEVGMNNRFSGSEQNETENARARSSGENADVEAKPKDMNTTSVPAGLGLRGLRPLPSRTPKRPGRQQQTSQFASSSEQDVQNQGTSANEEGSLVSATGAERNAQGASLFPDINRSVPSQTSPIFQLLNQASSRRSGGGGLDIGNLMSQLAAANAGGTTASTRARDPEQGLGLPAGALGNLMGQVMQNPFMRNVVQQVVEQVGEGTLDHEDLPAQGENAQSANPQGGMDFSRLLQDMMPVVSQAINRVGGADGSNAIPRNGGDRGVRQGPTGLPDMLANGLNVANGPNLTAIFQQMMPVVAQAFGGALTGRPEPASRTPMTLNLRNAEDRDQERLQQDYTVQRDEAGRGHPESTSSEGQESAPLAKRQKIVVEKALEKLEQGSSPDEILRVIAETASMLMAPVNDREANASLVAQLLCEDDGLADDYMALLLGDLASGREDDA